MPHIREPLLTVTRWLGHWGQWVVSSAPGVLGLCAQDRGPYTYLSACKSPSGVHLLRL